VRKIALTVNAGFLVVSTVCYVIAGIHLFGSRYRSLWDDPFWITSQICLAVCLGFFIYRRLRTRG
jgi:hypothetical protein